MGENIELPSDEIRPTSVRDTVALDLTNEKLVSSKKMREMLDFQPTPIPPLKEPPIMGFIKKIPMLTGFLRSVDHAGNSISNIAKIHGDVSDSLKTAIAGFQFTGLTLTIIDFLRIPAIYLSFLIVGEKPPITLSKNARWVYSAVLLGLAITALALPAVAVPIALTMASLGLGLSLFTMAKTLYQRYQVRKELKAIKAEIATTMDELEQLRLETKGLEEKINISTANSHRLQMLPELDDERTKELSGELDNLKLLPEKLKLVNERFVEKYDANKIPLQILHDRKHKCELTLEKKGTAAIMDKSIAVALSSIALIGLVLSLFFPPVGLSILAASALCGALYFIARVTFPIIKGWIVGSPTKKSEANVKDISDAKLDESPSLSPSKDHLDLHTAHEHLQNNSTTKTMVLLLGEDKAVQGLKDQVYCSHWLGSIQKALSSAVERHDSQSILLFFNQVSALVKDKDNEVTIDKMRRFFSNFDDLKPTYSLLQQAIIGLKNGQSDIAFSEEDKRHLLADEPLGAFLIEQGVDLQILAPQPDILEEKDALSADDSERDELQQNSGGSSSHSE